MLKGSLRNHFPDGGDSDRPHRPHRTHRPHNPHRPKRPLFRLSFAICLSTTISSIKLFLFNNTLSRTGTIPFVNKPQPLKSKLQLQRAFTAVGRSKPSSMMRLGRLLGSAPKEGVMNEPTTGVETAGKSNFQPFCSIRIFPENIGYHLTLEQNNG